MNGLRPGTLLGLALCGLSASLPLAADEGAGLSLQGAGSALQAVESGQARGQISLGVKTWSLSHAVAFETTNDFDRHKQEIHIILSDAPVTFEDVEDDEVRDAGAHLVVQLDATHKLTYVTLNSQGSEYGTPEGVSFEGSVDAAKKLVAGKVFSKGPVDVMGKTIACSATFTAQLYKLEPAVAPTAQDRDQAARSEPAKVYSALLAAVKAEDAAGVRKLAAGAFAREFDEYYGGTTSAIDLPGPVSFTRVTVQGDRARLLLASPGRSGLARLERAGGVWRIVRLKWNYR